MDTIPGCLEEFDVHTIIEKYGKQPDLLELILSCKAQEDKRKTEEAKLKQRELDYLISNEGILLYLCRIIAYCFNCLLYNIKRHEPYPYPSGR